MREEIRETIDKAKRAFAEMLLRGIDTAMISLDVSEATRNPETRDAERRTGLHAYETISRSLDRHKFTPEDRDRVIAALQPLKSRLDGLGLIPSEA